MGARTQPVLSVIVVVVSDTTRSRYDTVHLAGTLAALSKQSGAPPLEIIVPYIPPLPGVDALRRQYPEVRFVPETGIAGYDRAAAGREHHDELRARGLALATGRIVALLEDHGRPDPQWAAKMAEAHDGPYAGVGGAIENGIDRPLNWAVYFCDFGRYQNPLTAGESDSASDANSSYKRAALDAIRQTWRRSFQETAVNQALRASGEKLAHSPGAIVYQHRLGLRLGEALKERFIWGRSYGASRSALISPARRLAYAVLSGLLPPLLVLRIARTALSKGRTTGALLKALPLLALLTTGWAYGEFRAYVKGRGAAALPARAGAAS